MSCQQAVPQWFLAYATALTFGSLLASIVRIYRKFKVPNYQNGHAYLTSHRVCYVAVDEPRKYSVAIDLKEIDRADYQVWLMVESVLSFASELTLSRQGF